MKRFALMVFLFGAGLHAHADATSAADYFNLGAATFIREDPEAALAIVNEGLQFHPEDEPLKKLKALLEQQQESQSEQSDQSDQSDQSEEPQESDPPDQSDAEQDQQPQPQEPSDPQDQPQDQPQADEMTEDEAEMVLDSLRQLEEAQRDQLMQEMIRRQIRDMPPVEKDW